MNYVTISGEQWMQMDYELSEGLRQITSIIKSNYLAKVSGVPYVYISYALTGGDFRGTKYKMSNQKVDAINQSIHEIASDLLTRRFYLSHCAEQICELKAMFNLSKFFDTYVGKSRNWLNVRIIKTNERYYNKFTQNEVSRINCAMRELAADLIQVHLKYYK